MCGLIAGFSKKGLSVNEVVSEAYQAQQNRGQKGFGFITIDDKEIRVHRSLIEAKFLVDLMMPDNQSSKIIAHHRMPTSTPNLIAQTHPIAVFQKGLKHDYYVIHNGVIRNDKDVRELHIKDGFTYSTDMVGTTGAVQWNDSEAFAIELTLYIEGKLKDNLRVRGSAAFIALQMEKETGKPLKVYFGSLGNPLVIYNDEEGIVMASEGEGEDVEADTLHWFDPNDKHKVYKLFKEEGLKMAEYTTAVVTYDRSTDGTFNWDEYNKRKVAGGYWKNNEFIPFEKSPMGFSTAGTEKNDGEEVGQAIRKLGGEKGILLVRHKGAESDGPYWISDKDYDNKIHTISDDVEEWHKYIGKSNVDILGAAGVEKISKKPVSVEFPASAVDLLDQTMKIWVMNRHAGANGIYQLIDVPDFRKKDHILVNPFVVMKPGSLNQASIKDVEDNAVSWMPDEIDVLGEYISEFSCELESYEKLAALDENSLRGWKSTICRALDAAAFAAKHVFMKEYMEREDVFHGKNEAEETQRVLALKENGGE